MNLTTLSQQIQRIAHNYVSKFNIKVEKDTNVLKLQEEVGEFTKAYLKYRKIGKNKENKTDEELRTDLEEELTDVIAQCLLFAAENNIDLDKTLYEKWLKHGEDK